jgi:Flp pilus assembly protein TadD
MATLTLTCSGGKDAELREKAVKSIQAGKAEAALRELQRIRKPSADDYNLRGEVLFSLGRSRFAESEIAFQRALQMDSRNARALYGLAVLAVARRDFPGAERLTREILAIQPDAPHPRNLLAGALMYQGKDKEAEALFQGLEANPNVGILAKGNLGELYLRQRRLELAESKLLEAVRLMPDHPEWHKHLGEVYRLQGQRTKAITEYRTAQNLLKKWTGDTALRDEVAATLWELEGK